MKNNISWRIKWYFSIWILFLVTGKDYQIIVQLKGWRDLRGLAEFAQSLIVDHSDGKSHSFIHLLYNSLFCCSIHSDAHWWRQITSRENSLTMGHRPLKRALDTFGMQVAMATVRNRLCFLGDWGPAWHVHSLHCYCPLRCSLCESLCIPSPHTYVHTHTHTYTKVFLGGKKTFTKVITAAFNIKFLVH